MREKLLRKLAFWHSRYPWRMLAVVAVLTLIFGWFGEHLEVTMRWSDLLPADDKRTEEFNKVIEGFSSATSLVVVVQGEEGRIKAYADRLAPQILELIDSSKNAKYQKKIDKINLKLDRIGEKNGKRSEVLKLQSERDELERRMDFKLFNRIDYKMEVDFLKKNGLLLIKQADLENMKEFFLDANLKGMLFNLNNSLEKEYVGQEESISTREKEDQAVALLDGIQDFILTLQKSVRGEAASAAEIRAAADQFLLGEPYFLSYDKRALVLNAIPNFSMMDLDLIVVGTDRVQAVIDDLLQDFPEVEAGLTGFIAVGRDETVYSQQALGTTTVIALLAILILLMLSFKMWVAPLLAIGNLIVGLIWAIGTAALMVGKLNIMTQMMAVILLGLGIDFSIHLMSGFTERRAAGEGIAPALEKTFIQSGKGILTGGMTTATAFLAMAISHSRGMKEMGFVTGFGLLAILLSTMLFMPVLLVFREIRLEKRLGKKKDAQRPPQRDITFRFLGRSSRLFARRYLFTITAAVLVTAVLIWAGFKIQFDHNYMNIEPKGLKSVELQDVVLDKFDMGMDYALILTDNPDSSRVLAQEARDLGSVARTEDISLYLPSSEQQEKRTPLVQDIRRIVQASVLEKNLLPEEIAEFRREIYRLRMNIIEIQDMAFLGGQDKVDIKCRALVGDPESPSSTSSLQEMMDLLDGDPLLLSQNITEFQQIFSPYFKESVLQMSSTESIRLSDLPDSILDRYSNSSRDQFLVTVFPASDIWKNAEFLKRFTGDLESVSDRATGMPPVFQALIRIIGRDGRNAMLLTLVVVFLMLCLDFRNPRHALMAMIPLAAGVFWMVGIMKISGMMLTVMNVMGFPLIIGIGIDDGVHIIHRWKQEGRGQIMKVFSSTGKAILLTSLTTMLAFGSLVFSIWRGFGHLGGALFIGVGACFLTTVTILPGIIGWIERKKGIEQ